MKKRKAEDSDIAVSYKEARKKGVGRVASLVGKGQIEEVQEEAEVGLTQVLQVGYR